ncbi:MAG: hypothetical protein RLZZ450_1656 [Pseudomonadota bacterium]|jgi:hypothetical protein
MQWTPHLAVQRAKIAHGELRQEDVRLLDDGPTLVAAHAEGPPRLWAYLLDSVLDGFYDGFMRPHDGRTSTRVHQGLRVAQQALRGRVEGLVEKRTSDVGLLALSLEGSVLHVLAAGSQRAYLLRHRVLRRLARADGKLRPEAGNEPVEGVLKLDPTWCAEQLEPGDVLFASAGALCTDSVLRKVCTALEGDRTLPAKAVVDLLNGSAADLGLAAASLAFRVPAF